jgi:DNA topoisomerase-2
MARFVEEIISGKLVVARKKKTVLIEELRKAKYRPFPKDNVVTRVKNTDEEMDQEEDADKEDDVDNSVPGAGDYDYLLSVSQRRPLCVLNKLTNNRCKSIR